MLPSQLDANTFGVGELITQRKRFAVPEHQRKRLQSCFLGRNRPEGKRGQIEKVISRTKLPMFFAFLS